MAVSRTLIQKRPVTTAVETTNEQLYGNDAAFFVAHLGPKLKYMMPDPAQANDSMMPERRDGLVQVQLVQVRAGRHSRAGRRANIEGVPIEGGAVS